MQKNSKIKTCLELFWSFFKIGLFTFGGGMAMIPLIEKETAEKKHWVEEKDILEIIAISETTPGPIAINSATFIGFQTAGFAGALASTFGVVLPSFIIISVISRFLSAFESIEAVRYAFFGIRAGVIALIVKALWGLYKKCPKTIVSYIIIALAFVASVVFGVNAILIIACSGLIGLGSFLLAFGQKKDGENK